MRARFAPLILALAALALLAGCGDEESTEGGAPGPAAMASGQAEPGEGPDGGGPPPRKPAEKASGPTIVVTESEYGRVLVDSEDQAIYIFENDEPNTSNCSGQCAADWPPVLTEDAAIAGAGVRRSLLGTTTRDDGTTQVTYDGKPLYYYANEGPGQILCHNVNLNGGYWWVLGPDGERRP